MTWRALSICPSATGMTVFAGWGAGAAGGGLAVGAHTSQLNLSCFWHWQHPIRPMYPTESAHVKSQSDQGKQ